MHALGNLPIHPTAVYPAQHSLAGQAVRALWVAPNGRVFWPIAGGDGTGDGDNGSGSGSGSGDGKDAGDGKGKGKGTDAGSGSGGDLGFPKDTPVSEMTPEQRQAYDAHKREQNRRQREAWREATGDLTPEQVKADLAELAKMRKDGMSESERAVAEAEERGRNAGTAAALENAADAIVRAQLEIQGHDESEVDEIVAGIASSKFIADGQINTTKLTDFVKRFEKNTSGTGTARDRARDFGAGRGRSNGGSSDKGKSAGKAEAKRRFGNTGKSTSDDD